MKPRRIAIIPARGGSKRLPDKNIRPFHGKPMMGHILDAARKSGLFEMIHVSTEDDRIRDVAESLGYPVDFMRPHALADDHTPIMPVLRYVVDTYLSRGKAFDQVALLMACAPLIDASDLCEGAALFDRFGGTRAVMSITSYPVPVEWAYSRREDGVLEPMQPGMFAVRSQDLPRRYYETGCYTLFPVQRILEGTSGDDTNFVGQILPRWKSVDIDDAEDWELAERLFQRGE
ncbi:MAG: acylneuraminate cytidylyltransferase family protein [Nitrospirae bacterium]|nr:acylneuraminate cytidylyltransferase family protein [Magnetococcales bacterium]HAT51361.1 pseudaminic acid cytidylyltransferase [Alphaproteobacteria bacterium]